MALYTSPRNSSNLGNLPLSSEPDINETITFPPAAASPCPLSSAEALSSIPPHFWAAARRLLFVLFYFSSARSPPFLTPVPRQRQAARLMVKWGIRKGEREGRKEGPPSTSCALSLGGLISFFFLSAAWASLSSSSSSFCLQFPRSSPPPSGRGKERGGERRASLLSYTRRGKRGWGEVGGKGRMRKGDSSSSCLIGGPSPGQSFFPLSPPPPANDEDEDTIAPFALCALPLSSSSSSSATSFTSFVRRRRTEEEEGIKSPLLSSGGTLRRRRRRRALLLLPLRSERGGDEVLTCGLKDSHPGEGRKGERKQGTKAFLPSWPLLPILIVPCTMPTMTTEKRPEKRDLSILVI